MTPFAVARKCRRARSRKPRGYSCRGMMNPPLQTFATDKITQRRSRRVRRQIGETRPSMNNPAWLIHKTKITVAKKQNLRELFDPIGDRTALLV